MAATKLTAVFNGIDEWYGCNALSGYKDLKTTSSRVAFNQAEWEIMWECAHIGDAVCPPAPELPKGKLAVCVLSCGDKHGEKQMETPRISTDEHGNLVVDYKNPKFRDDVIKTIPWEEGVQHYYLKFIDDNSFKAGTIFRSPRPF